MGVGVATGAAGAADAGGAGLCAATSGGAGARTCSTERGRRAETRTTAFFVCVEPAASAAKAVPRATMTAAESWVRRRRRNCPASRAIAARALLEVFVCTARTVAAADETPMNRS